MRTSSADVCPYANMLSTPVQGGYHTSLTKNNLFFRLFQPFFDFFGISGAKGPNDPVKGQGGCNLSGPVHCAIPRDYLSDTPLLALWGFWCLNMANWARYPSPFLSVSPWRACKLGVRCTPFKGVSQRYLRNTLGKQGKWVRYHPLRYYLGRVLRDMGGDLELGR